MPRFREDLNAYIEHNLNYSDSVIPTPVYVTFIIEKDGSVSNVFIIRGSNSRELNKNVLKIFSSMPKWSPGIQDRKAIRVRYNIPIHVDVR